MEYLRVELFDRDGQRVSRQVKVDDELLDVTEEKYFELARGTHFVSLAPPDDFTPDEQEVRLIDTTVLSPLVVRFDIS